jgi:hypothetical protein
MKRNRAKGGKLEIEQIRALHHRGTKDNGANYYRYFSPGNK